MARYFRKVIRISALDSPNVQAQRQVIPGVLTWEEYQHRLATWDEVRICVGLRGEFYKGSQLLLFPPDWLDLAERNWLMVQSTQRTALAIGCDPGEGGANSSWSVIDDLGVIEIRSEKTPQTTDVVDITLELMDRYNVRPERVGFDSGGGGKQHADWLRKMGHNVRTVGFGRPPSLDPKRGLRMLEEKVDMAEEAYAYMSRRVEMYHELSQLCDPALNRVQELPGFAIPPGVTSGTMMLCPKHGRNCLRNQLAMLPKMTDKEGRYKLPPKNKTTEDSKEKTLVEMIGHSPDEADAVCIAVHVMKHEKKPAVAGAIGR